MLEDSPGMKLDVTGIFQILFVRDNELKQWLEDKRYGLLLKTFKRAFLRA